MSTPSPAAGNGHASVRRDDSNANHWLGLTLLLVASLLVYFTGLSRNTFADSYVSAAVQAGADNWKAFFFGSVDIGNSTTLSFFPIGLWPSILLTKFVGLSNTSLLIPQAIFGFLSVTSIYFAVHNSLDSRYRPHTAALISSWAFLLTPLAVLAFRYNYPDAMMVFCSIQVLAQAVRAFKKKTAMSYILLGLLIGLGILIGQMEIMLVVPGLIIAWFFTDRRNWRAVLTIPAAILSCGWYVLIVGLWPKDSRPWLGGTDNNSVLSQLFYTNGWTHLVNSDGVHYSFRDAITHPFSYFLGGQMSWFLPLALFLSVANIVIHRHSEARPMVITWSASFYSVLIIMCLSSGKSDTLCNTVLVPLAAVCTGIGIVTCMYHSHRTRIYLAITFILSLTWAFILLDRSSENFQAARYIVVVVGFAAVVLLIGFDYAPGFMHYRLWRALMAITGSLAFFGGPAIYTLDTITTAQTGSSPTAGPRLGGALPATVKGNGKYGPATQVVRIGSTGNLTVENVYGLRNVALKSADFSGNQMIPRLFAKDEGHRWVAAMAGGVYSANLQLACGKSVLPIGGFVGDTSNITLDQFKELVATNQIHYYLLLSGPSFNSNGFATQFDDWVEENFSSFKLEGVRVFDLTGSNLDFGVTGMRPSNKPDSSPGDPALTDAPPPAPSSAPNRPDSKPSGTPSAKPTGVKKNLPQDLTATTTITIHSSDTAVSSTPEPVS
ncbi:MAG: glycosyltransferase family 39 protein [Corynebacterium sp.]|nr:glycosyltransferase family 39 protein [Corynebacterium sp.]